MSNHSICYDGVDVSKLQAEKIYFRTTTKTCLAWTECFLTVSIARGMATVILIVNRSFVKSYSYVVWESTLIYSVNDKINKRVKWWVSQNYWKEKRFFFLTNFISGFWNFYNFFEKYRFLLVLGQFGLEKMRSNKI